MESEHYKSQYNRRKQLHSLWNYYFHQGNTEKIIEISADTTFNRDYNVQSLTYAHLGDRKKVDSINTKYPWGVRATDWYGRRAILHAVLKDRDSMYFYLNCLRWIYGARDANGRPEFDPYRNEERYKAFLRKNYLPVSGE